MDADGRQGPARAHPSDQPILERKPPRERPRADDIGHPRRIDGPAFYAYTAPEPARLPAAHIGPGPAFYSPDLKEFIYPYDDMRAAPNPRAALLEFLETTYAAGADLAKWDRPALERPASA